MFKYNLKDKLIVEREVIQVQNLISGPTRRVC